MQRRTFFERTTAIAAASLFGGKAPAVHGATDKADAKPPIVGAGEHRYECNHHWCRLPAGMHWETTHGVTVDPEGFIYITQQGHGGKPAIDTVRIFDPSGKFVRSFGKDYHPGGHGIDIRVEGNEPFLYLCNVSSKAEVLKLSRTGEVVWRMGPPKEAGVYKPGMPFQPTNLAFGPDGGFYVADGYGSNFIHQYTKDAKWVRTWGGSGKAPGKMQTPHGIWLDDRKGREPSLVVADRANARLQYFSLDGKHLGFVNEVLFPAHFDIRGDVLLVPDLHARVSLFDLQNKPIVHLGDDPAWRTEVVKGGIRKEEKTWRPGKFVHPHDACFDRDGNIFVVEWVETGRVTFLKHLA